MKQLSVSLLNVKDEKRANITNKLINNGVVWVHYDIMDGIFVANKAITFQEVQNNIAKTKKHYIDIHLMVASPENYLEKYKHIADSMTFHFETESYKKIKLILKEYQSIDVKIGLAINPATNIEQIYEFLPFLDSILIMSVIPGKGGQTFIPKTIDKIKKLRKYIDERNIELYIQIDGGINNITGPKAFQAGADVLVSGSFLANQPTLKIINAIKG